MPINYSCRACGESFATLRRVWCTDCIIAYWESTIGKDLAA